MSENRPFGLATFPIVFLAVVFTWELHEFFHWLTGTVLGNSMAMTLNTTFSISGSYRQNWNANVVDAAGPVITLVEAGVCFFILKKSRSLALFPFC